jgi:hypothetical protein
MYLLGTAAAAMLSCGFRGKESARPTFLAKKLDSGSLLTLRLLGYVEGRSLFRFSAKGGRSLSKFGNEDGDELEISWKGPSSRGMSVYPRWAWRLSFLDASDVEFPERLSNSDVSVAFFAASSLEIFTGSVSGSVELLLISIMDDTFIGLAFSDEFLADKMTGSVSVSFDFEEFEFTIVEFDFAFTGMRKTGDKK